MPREDDTLPEGSVVDGASIASDVDGAFDYVVIGTGAAGAVAAHRFAELGFAVAMVEEGPYVKTRDFGPDVVSAFRTLMRDSGTQAIEGRSFIPLLQGRCVGGSTVVNSAIAWRMPEDVSDDWSERFGLGGVVDSASLAPHFDALEHELHVENVHAETHGGNNGEFIEALRRRGIEHEPMRRYAPDCEGSGRCLQGCPSGAKKGMNVSYVPWALRLGARLYCSCRVVRARIESGRATAVEATAKSGKRVLLRAKRGVVVAASTIQTPNLLRRSGLRARAIGKHFQAHPGIGVAGVFDRPIRMDFGTTQGAETAHFRKSDGFKVETISMPPELLAARMPGAGADLMKKLGDYPNIAVWGLQIRSEAEGVVKTGFGGRDKVVYSLGERDMMKARKALAFVATLMLEQGAREIWPGVFGLPSVMRSVDEARALADGPADPRAYGFIATHLFGAARMGADPRASVVGTDFQTHEARGLYVVDSSVFPTNLGVNPQHSIMAVARLAATRIGERATASSAA
ncbi:MAG TPA: GMC family oxidoreductase [Polyangiaceae bacterium]|jgi:choline dehydrogenase-like flavoprotein